MSKEWEPDTVFDVLGSETAREILALASTRPMPAHELADACDVSLPTVYRRVNVLVEYDMLTEETRIDDDGNHFSAYDTNLERVCFEVEDGSFEVDIHLRRDLVDRFDAMWADLETDDTESE